MMRRAVVPIVVLSGLAAMAGPAGAAPKPLPTLATSVLTAPALGDAAEVGSAIAISGNTLVVGAPEAEGGPAETINTGAVVIYTKPSRGWTSATPNAVLRPPASDSGDFFGGAVAIDGDVIVVSATGPQSDVNQGHVYVYVRPGATWRSTSTPTATLTEAPSGPNDGFGSAVAISGSTIVVGAGGYQVGSHVEQGAAFVFQRPVSGWATSSAPTTTLTGTSGRANDEFGFPLAMSGSTIVIGATHHASNGIAGSGLAYVFVQPAGGWPSSTATQDRKLLPSDVAANDRFGSSIAVSGGTVVVGSYFHTVGANTNQGAAYVFVKPASGWGPSSAGSLAQSAELTQSDGSALGYFSNTVAVAGNEVVAGAFGRNSGQGAAYLFNEPAGGWEATQTQNRLLTADDGEGDLGSSLALAGGVVFAGAIEAASTVGATYVFGPPQIPALTKFAQSPHSWRRAHHQLRLNPKHHPEGGTHYEFSLDQPADVTLTFARRATHHHHHYRHPHSVTLRCRKGSNRIYFYGFLSHSRKLSPGHYRLRLVARNGTGAKSTVLTRHFDLEQPRHHHHHRG